MATHQEHHADAHGHDGGHDEHGHGHGGLGHVVPVKVLLGVFGALIVLTVITVAVRYVDLDVLLAPGWNMLVAMLIATVKATLVCLFFMHLYYDKKLHTIALLSAIAFFALFVGFALMDRSQYEPDVRWDQNVTKRF